MTKNKLAIISVPVFAVVIILLTSGALFSGCYAVRQGTIMLGYLNQAIPIESLTETQANDGENTSEAGKNRRFVDLVLDIRRFTSEELGLKMSKNYTRYVKLDRDYLAAVVSASAADSFARHEWKFPIVGRLPYKGFFNMEDARKEGAKLEKKGLDVWIRKVDAFSTLGWFRDPLYSYMRNYSPRRLAELIIHESMHATVFIKGQAQFNEELAEFTGSEGARLYMETRSGIDPEEYRVMRDDDEDDKRYVAFIRELIDELQTLYESAKKREEKIREKELIIKAARERFAAEYESLFSSENYRGFSTLPVNNAYLELYRLYYAQDAYIAGLYERSGKGLPAFIAAAKSMSKKGVGREKLAEALGLSPRE